MKEKPVYQIRCCRCGKVFGLTSKRPKAAIICLECLQGENDETPSEK